MAEAVKNLDRPRPAAAPPAPESAPARTALDLLTHLRETGGPWQWLNLVETFVRAQSPAPTPEELYRIVERPPTDLATSKPWFAPAKLGTLRRLGKLVWGAAFEPEAASSLHAADEVKQLRGQLQTLQEDLAREKAHRLQMERIVKQLETERNQLRDEALAYRARDVSLAALKQPA